MLVEGTKLIYQTQDAYLQCTLRCERNWRNVAHANIVVVLPPFNESPRNDEQCPTDGDVAHANIVAVSAPFNESPRNNKQGTSVEDFAHTNIMAPPRRAFEPESVIPGWGPI